MHRQAIAYNFQLYHKELMATLISVAGILMLLLSLVSSPTANALNIGGPSDCDRNAVVRCGVHSTGALKHAYNSKAYVRGVYAEFDITRADMANLHATTVAGYVTKDGKVFVSGKSHPVATNAVTGGRQHMPGSSKVNHGGAIFYKRPPSVSFRSGSLPAFVSMKNGRFQFAVIASCGNAVSAKPTKAPKQHAAIGPARPVSKPKPQPQPQPAPAPTPSQTQSQSQSQEVNVNNTNINQNTQITEQKTVKQAAPAPTPAVQPQPQPTVQTTATTLPNTGPTGLVGAFLAAVGLGTIGYRRLLLRRFE